MKHVIWKIHIQPLQKYGVAPATDWPYCPFHLSQILD